LSTQQKGASELQRDRVDELKGTVTQENLAAAFSRDAQASRLWAMFARLAELEGFHDTARVLREMVESQAVFADGSVDFLRRVGDPTTGLPIGETVLNLQSVIAAELHEVTESLPRMAATAHAEGFPDVASWFETLAIAKQAHAERAREAMNIVRGEGLDR
jgi:rubrerythrin